MTRPATTEPIIITADALEAEMRAGMEEGLEFTRGQWVNRWTAKSCKVCLIGDLLVRRNPTIVVSLSSVQDDTAVYGLSPAQTWGLSDGYEDARSGKFDLEANTEGYGDTEEYQDAYRAAHEATERVFGSRREEESI